MVAVLIRILQQRKNLLITGHQQTLRLFRIMQAQTAPGLEPVQERGVRFLSDFMEAGGEAEGSVFFFVTQFGQKGVLTGGDPAKGLVDLGLLDIVQFRQFQHQSRLPEKHLPFLVLAVVLPLQGGKNRVFAFRPMVVVQASQRQHAKLADILGAAPAHVVHQGKKPLALFAQRSRDPAAQPSRLTALLDKAGTNLLLRWVVFHGLQVDNLIENRYKGGQKALVGQGFRKHVGDIFIHDMSTLREKITFILTAVAYLLFHLRVGADPGAVAMGTAYQILLTAPYALGFTYIVAVVFRRLSGKGWLPWDRLMRVFFTVGILFAFFFALYEYAEQGLPPEQRPPRDNSSVSRFFEDVVQKVR